ncbi:MAG TPA: nitroreductase family deazaflavin-dependent oxidoreductase [Chloroflexota bacterium]|nr:nitroreductase family deazaflavin-dependent oxidoreductase [Chloroflexota bacterium]
MAEPNAFNAGIIAEFRANGGKVGGPFAGAPLLLLTTTGAKTGRHTTTPLMYAEDGGRLIVFASKAGAPENPAWYHNLLAHPEVKLEVGTETFTAKATPVTGEERDRLYSEQAARVPGFAEYQAKTSRKIPVVALERAG